MIESDGLYIYIRLRSVVSQSLTSEQPEQRHVQAILLHVRARLSKCKLPLAAL